MTKLPATLLLLTLAAPLPAAEPPPQPKLLEVQKIWDRAPHNAFTGLTRFNDRWYLTFREGMEMFREGQMYNKRLAEMPE